MPSLDILQEGSSSSSLMFNSSCSNVVKQSPSTWWILSRIEFDCGFHSSCLLLESHVCTELFELCFEFSPIVESNFSWSRITGKPCVVEDLLASISCRFSVLLGLFKPSCYRIDHGHNVDLIIPSIFIPYSFRAPLVHINSTPFCYFSFLFREESILFLTCSFALLADIASFVIIDNIIL